MNADKVKRYWNFLSHFNRSLEDKKNVFIISHMRSRSTLLSHVLASHQQICGHRELHSSYTKKIHLFKTRASLYRENDSFESADYLLDKLLHGRLIIDERIFKTLPSYIFLLRQPEQTMVSMIKMHLSDNNSLDTVKRLEDYYVERTEYMVDSWHKFEGDKIYISSEKLANNTQETLSDITAFLGLTQPLSENYDTYKDTGKGGIGDPSSNITTGKIIKPKPLSEESKALLQRLDMQRIEDAYLKALDSLS